MEAARKTLDQLNELHERVSRVSTQMEVFSGVVSQLSQRAQSVDDRSEEHTSELQSLMRISYAVFCLKKNNNLKNITHKLHELRQYHAVTSHYKSKHCKYTSI